MSSRVDGFSLLEVLVAVVVVSVAITGALVLAAHQMRAPLILEDRATALALASTVLERSIAEGKATVETRVFETPFEEYRHSVVCENGVSLRTCTVTVTRRGAAITLSRTTNRLSPEE
jgi:prepilin-type N-terminal cleavage/methylation domain-containing protein